MFPSWVWGCQPCFLASYSASFRLSPQSHRSVGLLRLVTWKMVLVHVAQPSGIVRRLRILSGPFACVGRKIAAALNLGERSPPASDTRRLPYLVDLGALPNPDDAFWESLLSVSPGPRQRLVGLVPNAPTGLLCFRQLCQRQCCNLGARASSLCWARAVELVVSTVRDGLPLLNNGHSFKLTQCEPLKETSSENVCKWVPGQGRPPNPAFKPCNLASKTVVPSMNMLSKPI